MNPKISIIVPNYNHAAFLEQRLESIFNQTFQDFEVILLDDASTDESVEILKKYADHSKVSHFLVNENNSGNPFRQWKKGVELAKGEYIWIAESDDFCEISFLEKLLAKLDNKTTLIYCASKIIDASGKVLGPNLWASGLNKKRWEMDFINIGRKEIIDYLRYRNTIPNASAVLFKRGALKDDDFPANMNYCGDWYLWLELLRKGDLVYKAEALNYYRKHENSTRVIKDVTKERKRFREYFFIIKSTSGLLNRLRNIKKYDWILNEWKEKKRKLPNANDGEINFPLEFKLRSWFRK